MHEAKERMIGSKGGWFVPHAMKAQVTDAQKQEQIESTHRIYYAPRGLKALGYYRSVKPIRIGKDIGGFGMSREKQENGETAWVLRE